MNVDRCWNKLIDWLIAIDEWLHEYAKWTDWFLPRMWFCQWVWAEWHVWQCWEEEMARRARERG